MNFISRMESAQVHFELKYCERCGGLFVRVQAADVVYCDGCTSHLRARSDFRKELRPATRHRARNPRMVKGPKPRNHELQGAAQSEYLEGAAVLGVRA